MYHYFIVTIKSSRGIKIFKLYTTIEKDAPQFNASIMNKVNQFYMFNVYDIEILAVEDIDSLANLR